MGDTTRGGSCGGGVFPLLALFNFVSFGGLGGGGRFGLGSPVEGVTRLLGGETARVVGGDLARVVGGDTARVVGGDTARVVVRAEDGGDTGRVEVGGDTGRAIGGGTDTGKEPAGGDEVVRETFFESKQENEEFEVRKKC